MRGSWFPLLALAGPIASGDPKGLQVDTTTNKRVLRDIHLQIMEQVAKIVTQRKMLDGNFLMHGSGSQLSPLGEMAGSIGLPIWLS